MIKKKEILFLWDGENWNPNGDMLNDNAPRIDEETGRAEATDVRIKRTIRDELIKKEGEKVERGESLAFIYASEKDKGEEAQLLVQNAYQFGEEPPERSPLVHYLVTEEGVKSVSPPRGPRP